MNFVSKCQETKKGKRFTKKRGGSFDFTVCRASKQHREKKPWGAFQGRDKEKGRVKEYETGPGLSGKTGKNWGVFFHRFGNPKDDTAKRSGVMELETGGTGGKRTKE